jgi:hypothetical protein
MAGAITLLAVIGPLVIERQERTSIVLACDTLKSMKHPIKRDRLWSSTGSLAAL